MDDIGISSSSLHAHKYHLIALALKDSRLHQRTHICFTNMKWKGIAHGKGKETNQLNQEGVNLPKGNGRELPDEVLNIIIGLYVDSLWEERIITNEKDKGSK